MTTDYALDPIGLAQVLVATTDGQSEFYVPGLAQYNGSGWQYFAPDRLGSVRQIVDPTGQLLLAQSFDPFGNVIEQGGAGQSIFGYTGEQVDPTGLVYLRARYYDPGVGRFLTPDTIVPDPLRSVGWNQYAYVENNPIRFVDPSGHQGGGCVVAMADVVDDGYISGVECLGGGGGVAGGGGISRGGVIKAIAAGTAGGIGLVIANEVLETFPAEAPDFGTLPGTTLQEQEPIIPCGGENVELPPLPPFTLLNDPLGDIFYGTPVERPADVLGDGILRVSSRAFNEIFYNGTPISRRDRQRVANPNVLRDLAEEYPGISPSEWRKVEQWFEYDGEEYDLHWFEARGVVERGKVDY